MAAAALGRRLVLVAAPAGFGKTVALTRLIERLRDEACVAWISVDHDDDPLGLLACLIAALEPLDPPLRTDPDALIATAGGSRADPYSWRRRCLDEVRSLLPEGGASGAAEREVTSQRLVTRTHGWAVACAWRSTALPPGTARNRRSATVPAIGTSSTTSSTKFSANCRTTCASSCCAARCLPS